MFKIREHKPKSLQWWFENRGLIDMEPSYQRGGALWSKAKKRLLIDSILNGYDIPKIYLADFSYAKTELDEKGKLYAVIDGKQRFEAIFEYFEGKYALSKDIQLYDQPDLELGGLKFKDLRRNSFKYWNRLITFIPAIVSVVTDDKDRIDDMFVRLNSGVSVNGAERRNAMPGIIPILIRQLAQHPLLSVKTAFDKRRMAHYNAAAKILLFETREGFVDTKAKQLDAFVKEGVKMKDDAKFKKACERVREVFDKWVKHCDDNDSVLARGGEIPVYYWLNRKYKTRISEVQRFLRVFTHDVLENLHISKERPGEEDRELSVYYTRSRSANDKGGMDERFTILEKHFLRK